MLTAITVADSLPQRPLVAAPAQSRALAQRVAELTNGRPIEPPAGAASLRRDRFLPVDLHGRGERLERVWLARELGTPDPIVAVNDLDAHRSPRDPVAIGIWSRFARPDQRLGARLSPERDGLTAEIALAVQPATIVLAATTRGIPVLVSTADQIAAELAGRSLLYLARPDAGDRIGPWEHPLVQRATELRLGVLTPSMIDLCAVWCGPVDRVTVAEFRRLVSELTAMIGLPEADIVRPDGILMS